MRRMTELGSTDEGQSIQMSILTVMRMKCQRLLPIWLEWVNLQRWLFDSEIESRRAVEIEEISIYQLQIIEMRVICLRMAAASSIQQTKQTKIELSLALDQETLDVWHCYSQRPMMMTTKLMKFQ